LLKNEVEKLENKWIKFEKKIIPFTNQEIQNAHEKRKDKEI
jgi:hypothetical protein